VYVAVLGLKSYKKTIEGDDDELAESSALKSDVPLDPLSDTCQLVSDEPVSRNTSMSDADRLRQCETVCDSGEFGTFTISYDAPSPRSRRQTRSLSHEEDAENTKPLPAGSEHYDTRASRQTDADSSNTKRAIEGRKKPPRSQTTPKALTGIPVARSVGDVARASRGSNTALVPRTSKKGPQTPPGPQPTWSCWRQESDVSDAVSEAGLTSGSGRQQRRSTATRSAPALTTRTNRTFALRCAAKKNAEASGSPASPNAASSTKPARSRSAENNARLALAARSGSGCRVRSQKEQDGGESKTRRESGDSSASQSSSLSVATHDGSYFRRDGGRFSMRIEKSNTTSCLSSTVKHLQVVGKSKPNSSQRAAKSSTGKPVVTESKEMTAWKRRKEYDARKSVAQATACRGTPSQSNQHSSAAADTSQQDTGLGTADEIAKLSNAVAYNLSVLSQSSQSDAVTLVSYHTMLCFILSAKSCGYCGCLSCIIY